MSSGRLCSQTRQTWLREVNKTTYVSVLPHFLWGIPFSWLWPDFSVRMFAPEKLSFSENQPESVFLRWNWKQPQYKNLNITCEANVSSGESNTLVSGHTRSSDTLRWCCMSKLTCLETIVPLDWIFCSRLGSRSVVWCRAKREAPGDCTL